MPQFSSNQEFFDFIRALANRLECEGNSVAAKRLLEGMACVNGLTDGWALFMDAVATILESPGGALSVESEADLREALGVIKRVVYR